MELTFLGTGTSTGVPQMRCTCKVCRSLDSRDKRLRTSALIRINSDSPAILIDCGPDVRQQLLAVGCPELAALLITHIHYDHVGGLDDLRPYCSTAKDGHFPVYCSKDVEEELRVKMPYSFARHLYPGVPTYAIHTVAEKPFSVEIGKLFMPVEVIPLKVLHYKLPILGYRIGKLAYITDCSYMPPETLGKLSGVDTLVINSLRHEPHLSHFNLAQTLDIIDKVKPRIAYLIHLSHDMGLHSEEESKLPENVKIAYDFLSIDI